MQGATKSPQTVQLNFKRTKFLARRVRPRPGLPLRTRLRLQLYSVPTPAWGMWQASECNNNAAAARPDSCLPFAVVVAFSSSAIFAILRSTLRPPRFPKIYGARHGRGQR